MRLNPTRHRWRLIGIDFHRRWRGGNTRLDMSGYSMLSHHGFFTLEWAREPHVEYYRRVRAEYR